MAKTRVYELAREFNVTNGIMLQALNDLGYEGKSHTSALDDEDVVKIKKALAKKFTFVRLEYVERNNLNRKGMFAKSTPTTGVEIKKMDLKDTITDNVPKKNKKPLEPKRIELEDGETGRTYENLFGEYLRSAKRIEVEDKYIRTPHQISNFIRLCNMLKKMGAVKDIHLITGNDKDKEKMKSMTIAFEDLRSSLKKYNISFSYEFSRNIHDRKIRTETWVIDLGRGLDFYKKPESWNTIEALDYEQRPCLQTTINISRIND